jgi:hypothetical protein
MGANFNFNFRTVDSHLCSYIMTTTFDSSLVPSARMLNDLLIIFSDDHGEHFPFVNTEEIINLHMRGTLRPALANAISAVAIR